MPENPPPAGPPPLPPPPLPARPVAHPEFVIGGGGSVAVARPAASRAAWIVAIAVLVVLGASAATAWFVARSGGPELRSLDAVPADAVTAMAINTDLSSQAWIDAGVAFQRLGLGLPEDALRNFFRTQDVDFQRDVAPVLGGDLTIAVLDVPGFFGLPLDPAQLIIGGVAIGPTGGMELDDETEPVIVVILRPADVVAAEEAITRLAAENPEEGFFEVAGEYVLISNTADAVAAARAVVEGSAPGLTEDENVAAVLDGLPGNAVSVLVTAPGNLPFETLSTVNADPACDPAAQLRESAVGAAITIDRTGFHLEGAVAGAAEAESGGESRLLAQVPAGVEVVVRGTGVGTWLEQAVQCLDPETRVGLERAFGEAGLTLEQAVGAIGDEIALAVDTSALAGGDGLPQFLVLLELTDPAVARQALDTASTVFAGDGALEATPNGYRFTEFGSGVSVLAEVREDTLVIASGIDTVTSGASIADDPRLPESAATDNVLAWVDLPAIINVIHGQMGDGPLPAWVAELESWIAEYGGSTFVFDVTLTPEEA